MRKYTVYTHKIRHSILLVTTLFVLTSFLFHNAVGTAYTALLKKSHITVTLPPVYLQEGMAGSRTLYTNNTSAKVRTAALAPTPTYYPNSNNTVTGTYVSGSVPSSLQTVDANYYITRSANTATSTTAYYSSTYSLVGSTSLVSGATGDLASNDQAYMTFRSYASATSAQNLTAHQDTTIISGTTYRLLKLTNADAAGTTFSISTVNTGRFLTDKFVYQLTGVSSIPASTWTFYYRVRIDNVPIAHADVDILIRRADGTVRTTIATNVANSANIPTVWSTLSSTYAWSQYTVVDQTDYLEIDYYIEVTASSPSKVAELRIDDVNLPVADQTRVTNINLPSQFTSEVEFTGSSNTGTWTQLVWSIDSAWTTGSVAVTIQVYNYTASGYPGSGNGYDSYTSSSTANTDESRTQTITTNPQHFRNPTTGYWTIKVKGVKSTTAQFDFKADWIKFEPTYYSQYTVSTEFFFSSMTSNVPTQLNFTVVSEYDVASVSVTIQLWNYSSPGYVSSGDGYLQYTSSGTNETKYLNITSSPQFFTSSGNARIKITGVASTVTQYPQKVNQIKLVYSYSSSSNHNYVLKIVNNVTDSWKIRLNAYSDTNKDRLNNCTIYFRNSSDGTSRQIYIEGGVYINQTGPWYDLPGGASTERYIAVTLDASDSEVSYVYVYLEILVPNKSTYARYVITFEIT